ncbi:exo-beta-N-acetylmuramidase NamZ family protein [Paradevosia shaoguanensis]|uniref:DUF1343 domain-containing protein n=1 Tax=Paradevosia shaoguanensis TaxID=1335043 RepID=A0AA41UAS6_9HYPH|nr:DUF1343 domain-containing protein [Paradevosia shaoguanensis]MCF1742172.1 DUF1343 domain-containing protein [Paradevosia shaoguanensis]MCI0126655.1 DUF1343 domain-containing protein [Paradevosia shaoguanensis]
MNNVVLGIDTLLAQKPDWRTSRIALVTNHAATTSQFAPSRVALLQQGFNVVKLFSPEHGLDTTGADGHAMKNSVDVLTRLPVVSLYGDKLAPAQSDLEDVDLVLFDIPDIGSRFYTYLWTMSHVLEACARFGVPLVIADRPNPLSGNFALAAGPLLDEAHCSSFIGRWSIPIRHSSTLGELARYFNASRNINCRLEVIPCLNWRRERVFTDWMNSFVPLSPAIPTFESALLYQGLCLLEATNCSEGRGTATPFRVIGAPWLLAEEAARQFNAMVPEIAEGVVSREITFTPTEAKFVGQKCNGLMLHVADPANFRPLDIGMLLVKIVRDLHANEFQWATYPTHVNPSGTKHLDLLLGIEGAEEIFDAPLSEFIAATKRLTGPADWPERMQPFLLYP